MLTADLNAMERKTLFANQHLHTLKSRIKGLVGINAVGGEFHSRQ